jgi:hypothetical protein
VLRLVATTPATAMPASVAVVNISVRVVYRTRRSQVFMILLVEQ